MSKADRFLKHVILAARKHKGIIPQHKQEKIIKNAPSNIKKEMEHLFEVNKKFNKENFAKLHHKFNSKIDKLEKDLDDFKEDDYNNTSNILNKVNLLEEDVYSSEIPKKSNIELILQGINKQITKIHHKQLENEKQLFHNNHETENLKQQLSILQESLDKLRLHKISEEQIRPIERKVKLLQKNITVPKPKETISITLPEKFNIIPPPIKKKSFLEKLGFKHK